MFKTDQPGVLVIIGSFQSIGILRSLSKNGVSTCLIDWNLCVGRFSKYTKQFFKCPPVTEEDKFLEFLKDLAVKQKIKGWLIYPNDDRTVTFLAKYKKDLEELYRVHVPDWDVLKNAIDKRLTYRLAEKAGIPIPRTSYPTSINELKNLDFEFPVIIKPAIRDNFYDKIRKKAIRADSRSQLIQEYLDVAKVIDNSEIMVQELIPGNTDNLYSFCSLYKDGQILGKIVAHRKRQHPLEFGRVTTHAETVDIPELEKKSKKFLNAIKYEGISEIEFMKDPRNNTYKLLEINARYWAWHSIGNAAGVDFPYLQYKSALGNHAMIDGFIKGVKWHRLIVDVPISASLIAKGKMTFGTYLMSWRGKRSFAVWSVKDPLPFLAEIIMIPYIIKIRGL